MDIYIKKAIIHTSCPDMKQLFSADKFLSILHQKKKNNYVKIEHMCIQMTKTLIYSKEKILLSNITDDIC